MLSSDQPNVLAEFYEKVLNKKPDMKEDSWAGWKIGTLFFGVGPHSEVKGQTKEPQRIMFNMETKSVKEEFQRVKDLGAKVIKELYEMEGMKDMWIATFADPDGNYFQLMTPWEEAKK